MGNCGHYAHSCPIAKRPSETCRQAGVQTAFFLAEAFV
nr:MAG TPA: coatomer subunit alpha [Caudoviricetes sp.]